MRKLFIFISLVLIATLFLSCSSTSIETISTDTVSLYSIKQLSSSGSFRMYEIEPREDGLYNIYGFLRVPNSVKLKHLVVKIEKLGKEQPYEDTTKTVREHAKKGNHISDDLNAITLFVSLPETEMHHGGRHLELDPERLLEKSIFAHLDEQVCHLIDDAELFIKDRLGIEVPKQVDMFGYSGEGDFIVRFALLHPQYLHAVCAGGISWSPSIALETFKGEALKYPLGLSEIKLYSKDFDLDQWKRIHFFIDMGLLDDRGSYNNRQLQEMKWSRNLSFKEVYDVFCDAFVNLTDNAEMVLYYTLGHRYNPSDYTEFLKQNDGEEFVSVRTTFPARVTTSSGVKEY